MADRIQQPVLCGRPTVFSSQLLVLAWPTGFSSQSHDRGHR